ncbi:peptide ABC transporter substrate-binding protein [Caldalkalibacillus thermarum]|uniref:peptide ABC transporter substrate-binding protein n=1 Tax=Caldalkalibacillus thermarum TaxID=296745 RepID=UPI001665A1FD|nr:peptide ABC transporter substrate-binding protein [Caldalkalibacillus thermarum]
MLLIFLLGFALLVSGCVPNPEPVDNQTDNGDQAENNDQGQSGEKILLLNNGQEPTSLDPQIAFDSYSNNILNNFMEGLTRLGPDHTPEPAIAETWEVSDDGKTYTFKIRDNAYWSNGDPVTAEEFEYAWKRLLDPETGSPAAFLAYLIEGAEDFNAGEGSRDDVQVKALDDKTLEVTLVSPQAYFLSIISNPSFFPVHKATVEANPDFAKKADTLMANGPFVITEWKHDSEVVMKKNEYYWDADNVKLDGVVWKMVSDPNTEYQLYQTGELHTSGVPADLSEQLFESGEVQIADQSGTYFFRFNVEMEPFHNQNIRKAFSMAVDRQAIVDHITKRQEKPAYGFVAYGFPDPAGGDFREVGGDLQKYDPEEARRLLEKGMEEEGYTQLPPITLTYNTSDEHKKIAEALQAMFKDVLGVEIELANQEWGVFLEAQKNLELQFSRSSFLADFADPINYLKSFQTGNPMNRTGWSNEEYDRLIQEANMEADEAKRFEMMHRAEEILFEEAPIFTLYFYNRAYLQKPEVTGIVRHPVGWLELKWADINN